MKKVLLTILTITLIAVMSISTTSFAQASERIAGSARWSYTNSTSEDLVISSNGTATMTVSVIGYKGTTTKIKIVIDLQKYSGGTWKKVKTYMDTVNSWYAAKEHIYSGLDKGYTYRLKCTYTVYSGTNNEYFIIYGREVNY